VRSESWIQPVAPRASACPTGRWGWRRRWRWRRMLPHDLRRRRGRRRQAMRAHQVVHERTDRDHHDSDGSNRKLDYMGTASDRHLFKPPRQIVHPPEHESREHVARGPYGTLAAARRVLQRFPEVRIDFAPARLPHARREARGIKTRPRPRQARGDERDHRRLHAGANPSLALRRRREPLACALRASMTTVSPAAVMR
jgi:hypothetical protein